MSTLFLKKDEICRKNKILSVKRVQEKPNLNKVYIPSNL